MHDATQQMANSPHLYMRTWAEVPCLAQSNGTSEGVPGGVLGVTGNAQFGDVIQVLKAKRDRYKGRGKLIQAQTVQACIDELRGVWR